VAFQVPRANSEYLFIYPKVQSCPTPQAPPRKTVLAHLSLPNFNGFYLRRQPPFWPLSILPFQTASDRFSRVKSFGFWRFFVGGNPLLHSASPLFSSRDPPSDIFASRVSPRGVRGPPLRRFSQDPNIFRYRANVKPSVLSGSTVFLAPSFQPAGLL